MFYDSTRIFNSFEKCMNPPIIDGGPLWDRATEIAAKQRSKGLEEYGKGLEEDTADIQTRLLRIEEELIDAINYIEHLKESVDQQSVYVCDKCRYYTTSIASYPCCNCSHAFGDQFRPVSELLNGEDSKDERVIHIDDAIADLAKRLGDLEKFTGCYVED